MMPTVQTLPTPNVVSSTILKPSVGFDRSQIQAQSSINMQTDDHEKEDYSISIRNGKSDGFKVPSGKEGSMKHRILTRPYSEKEGKNKPSIYSNIIR